MIVDAIKSVFKGIRNLIWGTPIYEHFNSEYHSILTFLKEVASSTEPKAVVLDAGAGDTRYRGLFRHTRYFATDICRFDKPYGNLDAVSDLTRLPFPSDAFDLVLNTQVLEHVPDPGEAVRELYRVTAPGGRLALTAPQGHGEHEEPADYFRFTRFALRMILEEAGFRVDYIRPRGGYFWYMAKRIGLMPRYLFPVRSRGGWAIIMLPLHMIAAFFCQLVIPLIFFYLDRVDRVQAFTLGYACLCQKPTEDMEIKVVEFGTAEGATPGRRKGRRREDQTIEISFDEEATQSMKADHEQHSDSRPE